MSRNHSLASNYTDASENSLTSHRKKKRRIYTSEELELKQLLLTNNKHTKMVKLYQSIKKYLKEEERKRFELRTKYINTLYDPKIRNHVLSLGTENIAPTSGNKQVLSWMRPAGKWHASIDPYYNENGFHCSRYWSTNEVINFWNTYGENASLQNFDTWCKSLFAINNDSTPSTPNMRYVINKNSRNQRLQQVQEERTRAINKPDWPNSAISPIRVGFAHNGALGIKHHPELRTRIPHNLNKKVGTSANVNLEALRKALPPILLKYKTTNASKLEEAKQIHKKIQNILERENELRKMKKVFQKAVFNRHLRTAFNKNNIPGRITYMKQVHSLLNKEPNLKPTT